MGFDASKVGENFILGFHGRSVPDWLKDFSTKYGLGGVIFFDYYCQTKKYENNIYDKEQVTELCREVHSLNTCPLIFVDQEGGKVRRLKESRGFEHYPSQTSFNTLQRSEKIEFAQASFSEMHSLGIDFNLAPVIDLNLNRENSDIGRVERSYSAHSSDVRENVKIVAEVATEVGIQLCLKHFPGVGGAKANSHDELIDLSESYSEEQEALFHDLVKIIPGMAILLSHGMIDDWEPGVPATVSKVAVDRIRAKNPQVLCITDDIHMEGLQRKLGSKEAALQSLAAGMDLVLVGNNMKNEEARSEEFIQAVIERAQKDDVFASTITESQARVSERKELAAQNRVL